MRWKVKKKNLFHIYLNDEYDSDMFAWLVFVHFMCCFASCDTREPKSRTNICESNVALLCLLHIAFDYVILIVFHTSANAFKVTLCYMYLEQRDMQHIFYMRSIHLYHT